jgi:predicted RNA binding protein YcfA (HicA-like mRNA interferase family)
MGKVLLSCGRLQLVGNYDELRLRILEGRSDANIDFDDLCHLLRWLGFDERVRGSHHVFRKHGVKEMVNLQRDASKAKPYQVRQVRKVILKYELGGERE